MRVRCMHAGELARVAGAAWVDTGRSCFVEGDRAFVPVRDGYPADLDLPERAPYRGPGYQMVGDVALVHGDAPSPEECAGILAWTRARGILHITGYAGPLRLPEAALLAGSAGEVVHRENGCTFVLDPEKVMFAQGNREEKARMAAAAGSGKGRVADMFAGIGYFTIPCAKNGATVHAMELNPVAFSYLERNIRENRVDNRVTADAGDCRDLLRGTYSRIIMGHFDAPSMLHDALCHAGAGTVLHVHGIGPADPGIDAALRDAGVAAAVGARRVKKYAPGRWHMVWDVVIE